MCTSIDAFWKADMSDNQISDAFEQGFLRTALDRQIANCDHYELAPLFRRVLGEAQPILEAGCGSGRWVAWFVRHGWQAVGIDWSEALCARAREQIPGGTFVAGDMRAMPFGDNSFGAIVSLGSVEHDIHGPSDALREYRRVLRPGGIAVITVPYLGPVRKMRRLAESLLRPNRRAAEAAGELHPEWAPDFIRNEKSEWGFFQYNFTRAQMDEFLKSAGVEVVDAWVDFRDEGILHNFGHVAGAYDFGVSRVHFSRVGRILRAILPPAWAGHMLCFLVRKPEA